MLKPHMQILGESEAESIKETAKGVTDSKSKKKWCVKLKEFNWKGLLGYSSLFK